MTITKELLLSLKLISIDITLPAQEIPVFLNKQNGELWSINLSGQLELDKQSTVILKFNFENYTSSCTFVIIEKGVDFLTVKKPNIINDPYISSMINALNAIETNDEKYGRRKEQRIPIGKINAGKFGLHKPEQQIIIEAKKYVNTCAIVDVSIHGIQIVTPYVSSIIQNINNFNIMITFDSPYQQLLLDVHKVYIRLNKINDNVYACISCQILEPINYLWKDRIIKLIENFD